MGYARIFMGIVQWLYMVVSRGCIEAIQDGVCSW